MSEWGYRPLADYGLLGDGRTAALVSRDGSVDWWCVPRYDSGSCFGRLLDAQRGGFCSLAPTEEHESFRAYEDGTLVLATTFRGAGGEVRLLDCLVWPDADDEGPQLLRVVEGVRGTLTLRTRIAARFDYGTMGAGVKRIDSDRHSVFGGDDALLVTGDFALGVDPEHELWGETDVHAGERARLWLAYVAPERLDADPPKAPSADELDRRLEETLDAWRGWLGTRGEKLSPAVTRSALTLRALSHERTGAMVAAATTSLPEAVGQPRNWDYRYAWIRDSSFAARSLAEIGFAEEANAFRRFVQRSAAGSAEDLHILYGVGGERRAPEQELDLDGWRGSRPVRVGNGAVDQRQLDAFGELLALAWRWHRRGHSPDDDDWRFLVSLVDFCVEHWAEPDQGLWEWRGAPEHFVHSKASCWGALDHGLRLAEECLRQAPVRRWTQARDELREAIEAQGYDSERGVFVSAFGRKDMDAALLLLPTTGLVAWDDERMVRTTDAVREELRAGPGLIYRYRREDGLPGEEGAFLACSFWLAEALAEQGRSAEAREEFDAAAATANDLGLFSEEWDPDAGEMLGNLPQALTHLSHIAAAVALERAGA